MRGAALAMPIGIAYYLAGPINKASRPDSPRFALEMVRSRLGGYCSGPCGLESQHPSQAARPERLAARARTCSRDLVGPQDKGERHGHESSRIPSREDGRIAARRRLENAPW